MTSKPAKNRPLVGVTLDHETGGGYSVLPWYALRQNYVDSITASGGLPLPLPHDMALVKTYLDTIDALVVTGGHFDVDPSLFGAASRHDSVTLKQGRTDFEWAVTQNALDRDMPILGICGGQQLLNVVLGGDLIQHIPDEVDAPLSHEQPNPRTEPGHEVAVIPGTLLHRVVENERLAVNSAHHQAVKSVAAGVVVNAVAPDGVIEGIESTTHRFCLGVQWHPEYGISAGDGKIFQALIDAI